jgi:predicted RNA-binding protein with TRAM domain
MVEIPDSLRSVFSATVRNRDGAYIVEIPSGEVDHDVVTPGETYRIAVFDSAGTAEGSEWKSQPSNRPQRDSRSGPPEPPVDEGEIRDVSIETVGDQGDGIAKVERGYVVIVSDARPGDEPTVKIEEVRPNVAFASVVNPPS